jgi:hypothetical protein
MSKRNYVAPDYVVAIEALLEENERLREDQRRLKWLVGRTYGVDYLQGVYKTESWRDAIDLAMREGGD